MNEIRDERTGRIIGFRCWRCRQVFDSMMGQYCRPCQDEQARIEREEREHKAKMNAFNQAKHRAVPPVSGKKTLPVSAVWLHAVFNEHGEPTDSIRVCLEIDGEWREVIADSACGHVSHCSTAHGWETAAVVDIPGRVLRPATGGVKQ